MPRSANQIIVEYNKGRVPEVLVQKYKMMAGSAFRFYRGTCHLFYFDLLNSGVTFPDSTQTWLCGDLHLENFGVYKGNNGLVYFDVNDFDESTLSPCSYDLIRFITSLYLSTETFGLSPQKVNNLAYFFIEEFGRILSSGKEREIEEPFATGLIQSYFKQIESRTKKDFLKLWVEEKNGKFRLKKSNPRTLPIKEDLKKELFGVVHEFLSKDIPTIKIVKSGTGSLNAKKKSTEKIKKSKKNIVPLDVAFRLAGTGSLGLNRYVVLVEMEGKLKLIDVKEAQFPSLNLYKKIEVKWPDNSNRICSIQTMMQSTPPSLLGTKMFKNKHYVIRELQPEQDKLNLLEIKSDKLKIEEIIRDMAQIAASAFIRSSGWKSSSTIDDLQLFASKTDWQKPIINYAKKYSIQVQKDYVAFKKDFDAGKIIG